MACTLTHIHTINNQSNLKNKTAQAQKPSLVAYDSISAVHCEQLLWLPQEWVDYSDARHSLSVDNERGLNWVVVAHGCNPSTSEGKAGGFLFKIQFEASLIYKVNSRTVSKDTEKPCLEKNQQNKSNKEKLQQQQKRKEKKKKGRNEKKNPSNSLFLLLSFTR